MAIVQGLWSMLLLALLSHSALALPDRRAEMIVTDPLPTLTRSCYSYTVTESNLPHPCPYFNPQTCGPVPECIVLEQKTITVPCANPKCKVTPTITIREPSPCPTCQKGCETAVMTITTTTGCASSISLGTYPTPIATS